MKKVLLSFVLLIFLGSLVSTWAILYTSTPLTMFASLLSKLNVNAEGLSGSLNTGLNIGKLSFGSDKNMFLIEKFSFSHGGLWDYFVKDELNVNEFSIGKLTIKVSDSNSKTKSPEPNEVKKHHSSSTQMVGKHGIFRISKFNISNVEISLPHMKEPFQLTNWKINNLSIIDGKLDFDQFVMNSNALDLELLHGLLNSETKQTPTSTDRSIKLVLKPTFITQLKKPLLISGQLRIDKGIFDKTLFFLNAFNDKATLKYNDKNTLDLQISDLNLSEFLNDTIDGRLTLAALLGPELSDFKTFKIVSGEFLIGSGKLNILSGNLLIPTEDSRGFIFHMSASSEINGTKILAQMNRSLDEIFKGNEKATATLIKIELTSVPNISIEDTLSQLVFSHPYSELTLMDKSILNMNKPFFIIK